MRRVFYAALATFLLANGADAKPPTLDPTYGLPLPSPAKAPPVPPVAAGNWIWANPVREDQTALFRRSFTLDSVPKSAIVHITCDDYFTLFVNGQQAEQTAPGQVGATDWSFVHTVDIAPFLTGGVNTLAVVAVNQKGAAGLLARLDVPGKPPVITDQGWRVLANQQTPADWKLSSFDDSHWQNATIEAPVEGGIWGSVATLQGWPGLDRTAPYLAHISLPVAAVRDVHGGGGKISGAPSLPGKKDAVLAVTPVEGDGVDSPSLVVDFGKEVTGRIQLTGLTSGTVLVGMGESYQEATQSPWRGVHPVHLTPGSVSDLPYSAFRYAKLTFPVSPGTAGPIRFRIALDHKYYPVQYKGSFSCSDPLITKLWYTGAYTSHLCMQEDIWDAPKRDRARWVGDLHVSGAVIDDAFADRFLMEQTLQRLRDDAQNKDVNDIPGYSCAWICTLADYHRHLGDYIYLHKQHDSLISLLEFMRGALDERGLFANRRNAWSFVDWSPGLDGNTPESYATTHLFYVKAVREAVFLLREMGDNTNADRYAAWDDELLAAARKYLPSPATGTYGDRLQESAMAVYSGAATDRQKAAAYESVLKLDSPAWDKTGTPLYNREVITPYYGNYVLRSLSITGHTDVGLRLLRTYWGAMLAEGATTFWEAYDPLWPKQEFHSHLQADGTSGTFVSLCHGWSSAPTAWLTDYVLGVRPTSGGFKTAVIQPDLGDLTWAEGDVPTPHGPIHVRADKRSGHLVCSVTVPPGVDAVVLMPGKSPAHIRGNGTSVFK